MPVPSISLSVPQFSGILYGAAYYAEYQLSDRLETDLDLMAAANFSVIRVGESVWSSWEPRNGEFELDWLQPVLDGAQERGIGVILGTPTYAVPPWLQTSHPEIAAERAPGERVPWGARQEVDFSHPAFLFHAERIIRKVVARYAQHPAVIGYQLDNEPGLQLFHNRGSFMRFLERLKIKYETPEALNREWGLTYWSHRITEWSQLWAPDGNTLPQYDLAWRRYQADLTTEFIAWQADIVREYSRPEQFVTTCIAYPRPALDDFALAAPLDVTAGNPYYGMQDHLAHGVDLAPVQPWTTTGVWGLFRQADRIFSSKRSRFLVTETNAQSIAGSDQNYPPYPGQLKLAAFAFISRGAAMIEYWHWHTLHFGTETYWGGVLPHSQRPGRIYQEVSQIGAALKSLGSALDGYQPDADVTLLFSHDSKWAFEFAPPLHTADRLPDRDSYQGIFDAFYRGVIEAGAQATIVHADQLREDPAAFATAHPVLVVPAFAVATDDELRFLHEYAQAGGHLVIGIRTGYGDDEARARLSIAPAVLSESAGVWYDEYSNLDEPLRVTGGEVFATSESARATRWVDGLVLEGADQLVGYEHPYLGRFPAMTTLRAGDGRITYVGTVPNPAFASDIVRWLVPSPIASKWTADASSNVTVASGTTAHGRFWFISNWSSDSSTITVPHDVFDLDGGSHGAGSTIALDPWACLVVADENVRSVDADRTDLKRMRGR
jgi:beta-galactosidase